MKGNSTYTTLPPSMLSAFGTLETGELTPIFQGDFVYGLNSQMWNTPVVSGASATVDTNLSRLRIQSGTASGGFAYITSRRIIKYRAGQGNIVRLTPIFTAGVANNIQLWGVGAISSNTPIDGYFYGYSGTTFGIFHYPNNNIPNFTAQANWNGDSGTPWDTTKGTPIMIKYPYLGYGNIEFFSQNPLTGAWVLRHMIQYANTTNLTELGNPSVQIIGYTSNSAVVTNNIMYCGSVGAFISGQRSLIGNPRWGASGRRASVTSQNNILAIKNATTYNGITNRGVIRLSSVSVGWDAANDTALLNVILNPTLGGSPSYTPISGTASDSGVASIIVSGNSISSFDISGTTISGGTILFNMALSRNMSMVIDLTPYDIVIEPSSIISFAVTGDSSGTARIAANWSEDI